MVLGGKDDNHSDSESRTFAVLLPNLRDHGTDTCHKLDRMIFVVNPSFLFARSSKRLAPLLPANLDDTTVMERHLLLTQTTFNDFPKPTNPCRLATPVLSDVHNKCTSSRLRNLGRRGLHPKLLISCTEALRGLNLRHCRIPESERLKCCPVETGLYIRQLF